MLKTNLNFTSQNLYKLLSILNTNSLIPPRIVGGAVRDSILVLKPGDIDIATSILPNDVLELLKKNNIYAVPTGIKFGTITAVFDTEHFEITTLRQDISCDGRWATNVAYTDDFKKDAERRDFTINALSYELYEQKLYDYFDGLEHLRNKRVVFIGNAQDRIAEDYLRILRFFRFSIRYANELDEQGFAACCNQKEHLLKLSPERITSEIDKIISLKGSYKILLAMEEGGIFKTLIPKYHINVKNLERANKLLKNAEIQNISTDGFYCLLLSTENQIITKDVWSNFRFSNKRYKKIMQFLEILAINKIDILIKRMKNIWYQYPEIIHELLSCIYINQQISQEVFLELSQTLASPVPIFPITSTMLMELGYSGKNLGLALNKLLSLWQESDYNKTTKELLNMLD